MVLFFIRFAAQNADQKRLNASKAARQSDIINAGIAVTTLKAKKVTIKSLSYVVGTTILTATINYKKII